MERRNFLKTTGAAGASLALASAASGCATQEGPAPDSFERDLALLALDEATSAGAGYADVRVQRQWFEAVSTRERQITGVNYTDSYGIGVRALVGGSWGFSATRELTPEAVAQAAREATAIASANNRIAPQETELAPVDVYPDGRWVTPHAIDPFDVPVEEKADYLFRANDAALAVEGVRFVSSNVLSTKESRLVATSEGSVIQQTFIRINPGMNITAVSTDRTDFQSRGAVAQPAGRGWEYVTELDFPTNASKWGAEAVQKLSAPTVDAGKWDLILHPSNLWLTIHESIAHPTELDRVLGYEANYAGTSFLSPPETVLNNFKLGPEFMTFMGDRTQEGGCSTCGWDDEAVPAYEWPIIEDGVLVNYQTTREQAAWISEHTGMTRSQGCAYGQNWSSIPFQRMPNISLMPNPSEDLSEEEVIAQTDHGVMIEGRGSYSIDQQRYNGQFAGQVFWEIRDGKKYQMIRDIAYVFRTPEFWNRLSVLGGQQTYELGATFGDGKGQPGQSNSVSHGCPTALFRDVDIINTA
jgi:TldD protein